MGTFFLNRSDRFPWNWNLTLHTVSRPVQLFSSTAMTNFDFCHVYCEKVKSWQGNVERKRNVSCCKLISSSVWLSCCVDGFNVQHRKQFFFLLMSCSQPDILRKCFVNLFFPQYLPVRTNFSKTIILNDFKARHYALKLMDSCMSC